MAPRLLLPLERTKGCTIVWCSCFGPRGRKQGTTNKRCEKWLYGKSNGLCEKTNTKKREKKRKKRRNFRAPRYQSETCFSVIWELGEQGGFPGFQYQGLSIVLQPKKGGLLIANCPTLPKAPHQAPLFVYSPRPRDQKSKPLLIRCGF